ncbi:MAG: thioredoxin domain-containing protein [Oligoflexia bacterium]|nr:thioredoxin domain-containing protein [Oligoflexia bacterium]
MKFGIISLIVLSFAFTGCVKKSSGGNDEENVVFATVNGKEIKGKDILGKVKNDLAELKRNEYEIKRRATEEVIQQTILEEEAKKQGTSVDKLFSQFDSLRDKEVGKDDIQQFLKQRNIEEKRLSKQEKESIPQIIKMQRVYEARQKYAGELRVKSNVQFKIPKPIEKVDISTGNGTPLGGANAKVTIVEFSDFQCPFCSRGRQRVDEIKQKYGDKVRVFFRHFPLESIHPLAMKASEASLCAQDQGKFWEYHDLLFDNQSKLDDKSLKEYATQLKFDQKVFEECLSSGKKVAEVRKDMEDGTKVGVNSTPTFFVNGYPVRGAVPLEAFSEEIDEQLGK